MRQTSERAPGNGAGVRGSHRSYVLVVDDDPVIRESLQWLLEDEGLVVETAADGRQAVDAVCRTPPSLIILDLGLPILSGEEVVAELRAALSTPPPIIVVTAAGYAADKASRLRAAAFFAKPYDLDELLDAVHRTLAKAERPR